MVVCDLRFICLQMFCLFLCETTTEETETLVPAIFAFSVSRDPPSHICYLLHLHVPVSTARCVYIKILFLLRVFCSGEGLCTVQYEMYLRDREISVYLRLLAVRRNYLILNKNCNYSVGCFNMPPSSASGFRRLENAIGCANGRAAYPISWLPSMSYSLLHIASPNFSVVYSTLLLPTALPLAKTLKGPNILYTKSSTFWKSRCTLFKVNRRFGGTCLLHLHCARRNQRRNLQERNKLLLPAPCGFLALLIFRPLRLRRHVPPKRRLSFNGLHGVMSKKLKRFSNYRCQNPKPHILYAHLLVVIGWHMPLVPLLLSLYPYGFLPLSAYFSFLALK
jgi:hypothetical protein